MTSGATAERPAGGRCAPGARVRTLLLGMGNPILSDDGVGIRLAREVGARVEQGPTLTVVEECCTGGLELLEVVAGFDRLIVLDSIKTEGGRVGDWYRLDALDLRETMHLNNVHDANFATAMELGRRMGLRLPAEPDIHILAVEIDDNLTFHDALSPGLEAVLPELVEELHREIARILQGC